MIFTKVEANLIRRGKKTALLALAKLDPITNRYPPPQRFRRGNDLSVQPAAGADELCRIVIDTFTLTTLEDLGFEQARKLGYRTTAEMAKDWLDRRGAWPQEEAICETCDGFAELPESGEDCPDCEFGVVQVDKTLTDEQTVELFHAQYGKTLVWLVEFTVPAELPRLLAAHSEKGYTTKPFDALPAEAEAVDETTLRRFARENLAKDQARQQNVSSELAAVEDRLPPSHLRRIRALIRDGRHIADRRGDRAA